MCSKLIAGIRASNCKGGNFVMRRTLSGNLTRTYRAHLENKYYSPFGEPRKLTANLRYRF